MNEKEKIYTSVSAFPNPQRLRLFLHEKAIAHHFEEVIYNMSPGGDQQSWRHLKMNPWGETPTLALKSGHYLSEAGAISRYLDTQYPGRKILGESALEQATDSMWESRIYSHILFNIVTMFHVLFNGLGSKIELVQNQAWGEHCRREAIEHAALVNEHLSDGREWMLGGKDPTLADITLCTAIAFSKFPACQTPLDERFEYLERFWKRWQERASFSAAYSDGQSAIPELDRFKRSR